jgi:hypothetical protein
MPVHDWGRVEAGIFHDFHHAWIEELRRALNNGVLPEDYYAMAEQQAAGFGPDVLTLQAPRPVEGPPEKGGNGAAVGARLSKPRVRFTAETAGEFYRRKKSSVAVRHVSGDRLVAMIEVVSPGNKASKNPFRAFLAKAGELLEYKIHLLVIDLHAPTKRDPHGLHAALWEDLTGEEFTPPADKPLTLAAYESGPVLRAYVEPVAVGDVLPDMPLFLEPGAHVLVPLEATYLSAWAAVPRRWRRVLEAPSPDTA